MLMGSSLPSHSAAATAETAETGRQFAAVLHIRGEVAASTAGTERKLYEGDVVYVGERVRAAALAEAVLKTEDRGLVAIRPGTEFVAEHFAAEDKPTDGLTLRLFTGSLRVISGWIARTNRSGHKVVTPTATIGIRGTDHEPYVLSAELAAATSNREGTYDKVNRGGTTMEVGENKLDIDPGRVGFVRAAPKETKSRFKERALMTILLPVLLDKVPNFYVPGEFDAELDRYSETADQDSLRQLEQKRKAPPSAPAAAATAAASVVASRPPAVPPVAPPAAPPAAAPVAPVAAPPSAPAAASAVGDCASSSIAGTWLRQLDTAIARHDAAKIIAMFAPEASVRATVRSTEGKMASVDLGREELAQSTIAAMKGLTNYKQRRVSIEGKPVGAACDRINVRSAVIEQGRQSGKPYRFESLEEYLLELRDGTWLSIKAETTQQ
jgi:hypothetical protein